MSIVEDEMNKANALRSEANRQANAEHMAEMAKQSAVIIPMNAVKESWDKRQARWAQLKILAAKQQKQ